MPGVLFPAFNIVVSPGQIVFLPATGDRFGTSLTVSTKVSSKEQPNEVATITVYIVVFTGYAIGFAMNRLLKPVSGVQ